MPTWWGSFRSKMREGKEKHCKMQCIRASQVKEKQELIVTKCAAVVCRMQCESKKCEGTQVYILDYVMVARRLSVAGNATISRAGGAGAAIYAGLCMYTGDGWNIWMEAIDWVRVEAWARSFGVGISFYVQRLRTLPAVFFPGPYLPLDSHMQVR
jgi:hypothetical protein